MMRIIQLLDQKNHYLEKFYALGEETLSQLSEGQFNDVEGFYQNREKILEMIRYIDFEVNEAQNAITEEVDTESRQEVKARLKVKEVYVSQILDQDLSIMSFIEQVKTEIIRELQQVKQAKRAVGGYKTRSFSHRLDEEA